ncbi:rod shape-determining protein RodA [Christensenellaceae bacterium OttesenSCG-928-M15]|nr:rod shape-determining protein RodA [Christensenellaceae bacterium OttesenSCG-928-M15]
MQSEKPTRQKVRNIDWITIILVLVLVTIGIITIANVKAEPFTGTESTIEDIQAKLNLEYVQRQIVNFLVGVAALLVLVAVDYHIFRHFIKYIYVGNVLLLAFLVLAGDSTRGIFGWITVGSRMFQPSEVCKITLIVALSIYAADAVERDGKLKSLKDVLLMCAIFGVPFVLVLLQPDFGTAIVFAAIFACILFMSKISWKYILAALGAIAVMAPVSYFYLLSDDQKARIDVFIDPSLDLLGTGMQVDQSKIAIGSGQMWGKGYFTEGTLAQLKYVPESHTDFIFSGIAEGLGFVGGTVVIALFFILMFRWLYIALRAKDHLGTCIAIGAMGMILAHVFENIGMTIGLMPVTGIPLPFVSYGGSNLLTNMMAVGLVLNIWLRRHQKR